MRIQLGIAAVCFGLGTAVSAQSIQQQGYVKRIVDNQVQYVRIHEELPPICDDDTIRAATTVNEIGSEFVLTGAGDHFKYGTKPSYTDDPEFLDIVPGSTSVMSTEIWWVDNGSRPVPYYGARVVVNANRFYYSVREEQAGDFACGTVTSSNIRQRIDYESAMLHEFGHFMGMYHRSDGTTGPCVMSRYITQGQIKRDFCGDEEGLMLGFYGTR